MSITKLPLIPRRTEPQGTIWVCLDCMMTDANGELPDDRDESQPEPWALWADWPAGELTMGTLDHECRVTDHTCQDADGYESDDCECPAGEIADECDCEHDSFSWRHCEGCGSSLGGERHAYTYWS